MPRATVPGRGLPPRASRALTLRGVVAEAILAALDARGSVPWLETLARALAGDGARVEAWGATRLAATGLFAPADGGSDSRPDLGDTGVAVPPLRPVYAAERLAAAARADCGARVARAFWVAGPPAGGPVAGAVARGARLFDAGLYFEVHEVLEAVWMEERGATRELLQGLIQIAVALHHLAHDNPRGARTLFANGRARLAAHPPDPLDLDIDALLAALPPWEAAARANRGWPMELPWPRMRSRGDRA